MFAFLVTLTVLAFLISVGIGVFCGELVAVAMGAFIGLVFAFCLSALPLSYFLAHHDEHTVTCTVTDKDRGGQDGSYRIYTEECGQLANVDSVWRGKFDSADVWQDIKPGHVYELTVVGARIPVLSEFPNVLAVEPVK